MKRKWTLILALVMLFSCFSIGGHTAPNVDSLSEEGAQRSLAVAEAPDSYKIYPTPHTIVYLPGSFALEKVNLVVTEGADAATRTKIQSILESADLSYTTSAAVAADKNNIILGIVGDNEDITAYFEQAAFADTSALTKTDGYVLGTVSGNTVIFGRDAVSLFYGVCTFKQMVSYGTTIKNVLINDYADNPTRGTVEGYYGIPWSFETVKSILEISGDYKLNTYIYGPKDDEYHHGPKWGDPYPAEKLEELRSLVRVADANDVSFVWAIHFGRDMDFNDGDDAANAALSEITSRQWVETDKGVYVPAGQHAIDAISETESYAKLFSKFEQLYSVGVRQFAVFADDIDFPQARFNVPDHVAAVNRVVNEFVKTKGDIKPILFCPTYYHQADIAYNGRRYMATCKGLDASVQIMYTGRHVMSDITSAYNNYFINTAANDTPAGMQRNPLIWWNYPVTDYSNSILLMGPNQGLNPNATNMLGAVSNPMQQGMASEIALFGLSDYVWNLSGYDKVQNWKDSFQYLFPEVADSLYRFAQHNQRHQDGNGYLSRNEESADLRPYMTAFQNAISAAELQPETVRAAGAALDAEMDALLTAVADIRENGSDALLADIDPWLDKCANLCNIVKSAIGTYEAYFAGDGEAAWIQYSSAQAERLRWPDITAPQLSGSVIVEVGAQYLKPFVNTVLARLDALAVSLIPHDDKSSVAKVFSNVPAWKTKTVVTGQNTYAVDLPATLDVHRYVGIDLGNVYHLTSVATPGWGLDTGAYSERVLVEYSENGAQWTAMDSPSAPLANVSARYVRLKNQSDAGVQTSSNEARLAVTVAPGAVYPAAVTSNAGIYQTNRPANLTDGDLATSYWTNGNQTPGQQVDIVYENETPVYDITLYSSTSDNIKKGAMLLSADGENWTKILDLGAATTQETIGNTTYVVERANAKGMAVKYIRLTTDGAANYWTRLFELRINVSSGHSAGVVPPTQLTQSGGWAPAAVDGSNTTVFTQPKGTDTLLYALSEFTNATELIVLQSPTAVSGASVRALTGDGWKDLGVLDKEYATFDLSAFGRVWKISVSWTDETSPIGIHEIHTRTQIDTSQLLSLIEQVRALSTQTPEMRYALAVAEAVADDDNASALDVSDAARALQAFTEGGDSAQQANAIVSQMTFTEKFGQLLAFDSRSWNGANQTVLQNGCADMIRNFALGGQCLFAPNVSGTVEQIVRLTDDIQRAAVEGSRFHIPMLLSIDQEGGYIVRLSSYGTTMTGNMAIGATGDPDIAYKTGRVIGEELNALGLNVDFAPVCDVNSNPDNPVIGVRSFSSDTTLAGTLAAAYARGLRDTGVIGTGKHFPGHGNTATDSHIALPLVQGTRQEILNRDVAAFSIAIDKGLDMIMTAHVTAPGLDASTMTGTKSGQEFTTPATLSKTILTDLLRNEMGFEGLIVTDAMNMAALNDNFLPVDMVEATLLAGVDLPLMPVSAQSDANVTANVATLFAAMEARAAANPALMARIEESARRVIQYKINKGIYDPSAGVDQPCFDTPLEDRIEAAANTLRSPAHLAVEKEASDRAITLGVNQIVDGKPVLPFALREGDSVYILTPSTNGSAAYLVSGVNRVIARAGLEGKVTVSSATYSSTKTTGFTDAHRAAMENATYVLIGSAVWDAASRNPNSGGNGGFAYNANLIWKHIKERGYDAKTAGISLMLPYELSYFDYASALVHLNTRPASVTAAANTMQIYASAVAAVFGEFAPTGRYPVDVPNPQPGAEPVRRVGEGLTYVDAPVVARVDETAILLEWNSVASAMYTVYLKEGEIYKSCGTVTSDESGKASMEVTNLTPGTDYVFRLEAAVGALFGASADCSARTLEEQAPVNLIPKPTSLVTNRGALLITEMSAIVAGAHDSSDAEETAGVAAYLAGKLRPSTGYPWHIVDFGSPMVANVSLRTIDKNQNLANGVDYATAGAEGYALTVDGDGVRLSAYTPEGLFRGVQTIRQLFPAEIEKNTPISGVRWAIPYVEIVDYPRYEYRGVMLDVARKFFPKEVVLRQIDMLSQYKINTLHLHLTDDQGYRIAFDGYPELKEFGGMTKLLSQNTYNTNNVVGNLRRLAPGSISYGASPGYYTKEDFQEIIDYAEARFVTIVPEIEFPSHSYSQLFALPLLNAVGALPNAALTGNNAMWTDAVGQSISVNPTLNTLAARYTRAYIEDIFTQLAAMLPPRHKYIHIGGDEASNQNIPDYNAVTLLALETVRANGKLSIEWNQADSRTVDHPWTDILQNWASSASYADRALSAGKKVLASLSPKAYLDHFTSNQMPVGHSWAASGGISIATAYNWDPEDAVSAAYKDKGNVIGVESPMWSETYGSQETMDMLLYPRALAISELGWSPKETRNGTASAAWLNFRDRLATYGTRLTYEGVTFMNETSIWPGKTVDITTDNSAYAAPLTTDVNTPLSGRFEFNPLTAQGDAVVVKKVSEPTQGVVTLDANGNWTYQPAPGFVGQDSFTVAFQVDGFGVPMGPAVSGSNRGIAQYNGLRNVHIRVLGPSNETTPVAVTMAAVRPLNIRVLLNPPVPGLLASNFTIPGETVRMAESYDNGNSYILVTTPRNANKEYALNIAKDGYAFNTLTFAPHNITPRPVSFVGESASFILKDTTRLVVSAETPDALEAARQAAQGLADTLRKSTGYPMEVVEGGAAGMRDIAVRILPKTQELAPGVDFAAATEEGYALNIGIDGAVLSAYSAVGLYRGIRAIYQLLPPEIAANALRSDVDWVMTYAAIVDYAGSKTFLSTRDGQINVEFYAFNSGESQKAVLCWLAEYDETGALLGVTQESLLVAAHETAALTRTIPDTGRTVKAFLWDAETYAPLCAVGELQR